MRAVLFFIIKWIAMEVSRTTLAASGRPIRRKKRGFAVCRLLICVTTASGLFALNVILSFSKLPTFIMWKGYPFVNEG